MMSKHLVLCLILAGCAHEPVTDSAPARRSPVAQPGVGAPPAASTRVEVTAVTLADDCGGTSPTSPPVKTAAADPHLEADADSSERKTSWERAKRRCEQTSMQLAIIAGDAAKLQVKSVELLDESGASLGALTASSPTRWSDAKAAYEPWDERVAARSSANVSYVLSQPRWDLISNRLNRTYTLKAVLSVGGVEQTMRKDVSVTAPTSLPPDVET